MTSKLGQRRYESAVHTEVLAQRLALRQRLGKEGLYEEGVESGERGRHSARRSCSANQSMLKAEGRPREDRIACPSSWSAFKPKVKYPKDGAVDGLEEQQQRPKVGATAVERLKPAAVLRIREHAVCLAALVPHRKLPPWSRRKEARTLDAGHQNND